MKLTTAGTTRDHRYCRASCRYLHRRALTLLASIPAAAATATTTFAVTATVQATCTVSATANGIRNLHCCCVAIDVHRLCHLH